MTDKLNAGYIGLGNIGKHAARHLICDAYNAHVYDIARAPVDVLAAEGAIACDSVAELARSCVHIGVCVLNESQVESLLYGEAGIFANAAADTIVAIHSTVNRDAILKWATDAGEHGIHLVDAGISGGAQSAEDGNLVYMVGGETAVVDRARPVFMTSADNVVHAGQLGNGMILKLCNNLVQYLEFMAISEAGRLAAGSGLDLKLLREVGLSNGVVNAQMARYLSGRTALIDAGVSADDMALFMEGFAKIGEKDLDAVLKCAAQVGVKLPYAERIRGDIRDMYYCRDPQ